MYLHQWIKRNHNKEKQVEQTLQFGILMDLFVNSRIRKQVQPHFLTIFFSRNLVKFLGIKLENFLCEHTIYHVLNSCNNKTTILALKVKIKIIKPVIRNTAQMTQDTDLKSLSDLSFNCNETGFKFSKSHWNIHSSGNNESVCEDQYLSSQNKFNKPCGHACQNLFENFFWRFRILTVCNHRFFSWNVFECGIKLSIANCKNSVNLIPMLN